MIHPSPAITRTRFRNLLRKSFRHSLLLRDMKLRIMTCGASNLMLLSQPLSQNKRRLVRKKAGIQTKLSSGFQASLTTLLMIKSQKLKDGQERYLNPKSKWTSSQKTARSSTSYHSIHSTTSFTSKIATLFQFSTSPLVLK